jgi:excinuclease ABC subunit A
MSTQTEKITIRGAREHNLKNINLEIPRQKLVVFTGVSGSGKSSLVFDTIYAEGQHRYLENLSGYAKSFLPLIAKPEVDQIEGLSPTIAIDQRSVVRSSRSTVGTMTEIYNYLRLLFSHFGTPFCSKCKKPLVKKNIREIAKEIIRSFKNKEIFILAPLVKDKKGEHKEILSKIGRGGYNKVRIDGEIYGISSCQPGVLNSEKEKRHNIEVAVDYFVLKGKSDEKRILEAVSDAFHLADGLIIVNSNSKDLVFSDEFYCPECKIEGPLLEPRLFSFNNPIGACPACTGLGIKLEFIPDIVIPNKNLTLAEGAIRPWTSSLNSWQNEFNLLKKLSSKHRFSLDEPVKDLPKKVIDLILFGEKQGDYQGAISILERRYLETESDYIRAELEKYMVEKVCPECQGRRLRPEALAVKMAGKSIDEIVGMPSEKCLDFFKELQKQKEFKTKVAVPIISEIIKRLELLKEINLGYLTLARSSLTISSGEAQRIKLADQLASKLSGVLYVLDEPSIGLHPKNSDRLIRILKNLRDLKNSILVVEHDEAFIRAADYVFDLGPGAGDKGGKIVAKGTPSEIERSNSLTGLYLSKKREIKKPEKYHRGSGKKIVIKGAKEHNLKSIDVSFPLGKFIVITGVSGSGKSTLVEDILARALSQKFYQSKEEPGEHKEITGLENLSKVISINQSPIGRTPRSNPATYTGIFTPIRELFAQTPEAEIKSYKVGHFSFNVKGGRCEACAGEGFKKIEMYFMPDVYLVCEECQGTRYQPEILEVEYKGLNIAQVLELTVKEAMKFFKDTPVIYNKLKIISDVGLEYLKLGQPATTLSGGEAQRIKLAAELSRPAKEGKTFYILDEPTVGLHFEDIKKLLIVLNKLVDKGNTVLAVEHNLDVVASADWVIDLGPEGGERGGYIIAEGTPEEVAKVKKSDTGEYLKKMKFKKL